MTKTSIKYIEKTQPMIAKSILLNWLAKEDLKKALQGLDFLANKYQNEQLRNDTALQSEHLKKIEDQRTNNNITVEDERIETTKIKQAVVEIIQGISNEWALEKLAVAPNKIITALETHWKKIAAVFIAVIGILASIAGFSGYSLKDIFKQNEPIEKTVKTEHSVPIIITKGDNSPAVITYGGDATINYNVDSTAKKDSTNK